MSVDALDIKKADLIDGLRKGLEVITAFDDETPRLTQSELAQRLDLSRAAARRYLLTLASLGYVASDGKQFWLTPKVMQLGRSYTASSRLPRTVLPVLRRLTEECGESSNFAVLEGNEAVYVCCINANRMLSTGIEPGTRLPAYTSTAGRVIASQLGDDARDDWVANATLTAHTSFTLTDKAQLRQELVKIKRQGFGISENQFELGLRGVSVPLLDSRGVLLGALSVSMAVSTLPAAAAVRKFVPLLQSAAEKLSPQL